MPYKPGTLDESDRTRAYSLLWLGLPNSLILLAAVILGLDLLVTVTAGFAAGTMLVAFTAPDEFTEKHVSVAARWAASAAGLGLIAATFPILRDYPLDPTLVLAGIAVVFHLALTLQRLKDR